ncbi:hypothetical protein [Nonomuraea sp. NPDC049684]
MTSQARRGQLSDLLAVVGSEGDQVATVCAPGVRGGAGVGQVGEEVGRR